MTSIPDRIQGLVTRGKISAKEGERLLRANAEPLPPEPWWNPFHRFGGERAALAGLVIAALSVAVTRLGVRFDGFLDLHVHLRTPRLTLSLVEQAVAVVMPALVFWVYTLLFNARARFIDFLGMTGLARLPLLIVALPLVWLTPRALDAQGKPQVGVLLLPIAALGLVAIVSHLWLLFQGFKNASGLRGVRLGLGFAALGLLCEVASKFVLFRFS